MHFSLVALVSAATALAATAPFPPTTTVANPTATKTTAYAPSPTLNAPIFPIVACNAPNFGSPCVGLGINNYNQCYNLPPLFNDSISSVNELYTNVQCHMFINADCTNADFYIDYQNTPINNIGTSSPPIYNEQLSSFYCGVF